MVDDVLLVADLSLPDRTGPDPILSGVDLDQTRWIKWSAREYFLIIGSKGSGTYTLAGDQAILDFSFSNLVPQGVYTVWCTRITESETGIADVQMPCGAVDGSQATFEADEQGEATFELTMTALPASRHEAFSLICVAYHSDGQTYGQSPGDFGRVTHVQLCSAESPPAPGVDEDEVKAGEADLQTQVSNAAAAWDDAFNTADIDRLMALYADEVTALPPNLPALHGKEALEADFRQFLEEFTAHHETTIIDLQIAGDTATEVGLYEMTMTPKAGGDSFIETGRHIVVYKKGDNGWKHVWEIWNSDQPPLE